MKNKQIVNVVKSILEATSPFGTGVQAPDIPTNPAPQTPPPPLDSTPIETSNEIESVIRGPEDQLLNSINKIINLKNKVLDSRSNGEINQLISQQNT